MPETRSVFNAAVSLLLIRGNNILLTRRSNTGWADGKYALVGGHIEDNETVFDTSVREAEEEIGIIIDPKSLKVVHTMHDSKYNYIVFYLLATQWKGEPIVKEKEKIDDIRWFPLNNLPKNIPGQNKQGLNEYIRKEQFSEFKYT